MANVTKRPTFRNRLLADKEKIKKLYWEQKLTHEDIAKMYGCSREWVQCLARKLEISGIRTSSRCSGDKNKRWRGGRWVDADGYVYIHVDDDDNIRGNDLEHRVIAQRVLGRKLKSNEIVHHINGNKHDNRNCNLLICDKSYHRWLEARMGSLYKIEHFAHL